MPGYGPVVPNGRGFSSVLIMLLIVESMPSPGLQTSRSQAVTCRASRMPVAYSFGTAAASEGTYASTPSWMGGNVRDELSPYLDMDMKATDTVGLLVKLQRSVKHVKRIRSESRSWRGEKGGRYPLEARTCARLRGGGPEGDESRKMLLEAYGMWQSKRKYSELSFSQHIHAHMHQTF